MKKMITMVMALVLTVSMTACENIKGNSTAEKTEQNAAMQTETISEEKQNEEEPENMMTGGWNIISGDMGITANPDAKAALEKAADHMVGTSYEPIALLGTQIVAGTNYCILCRTTAETPDAMQEISLVYVYQDLQDNAEITGSSNIIGEMLEGGFAANDGDTTPEKNTDVKSAYEKAFAQFTGANYEPIAYLGSQIVAGTNYLLLCRSTAVTPNAVPAITLVTIYADLNGNAEIINTEEFTLGETESQGSTAQSRRTGAGQITMRAFVRDCFQFITVFGFCQSVCGSKDFYITDACIICANHV